MPANSQIVTWTPSSTNAEQKTRDLIAAVMFLHTTFKDEVWLWRGQADEQYRLEPGMHSRVRMGRGNSADDSTVEAHTAYLIGKARQVEIDRVRGTRLPDLALLANLQHFGAATPLLDVTVDPLVALWMVAFASAEAIEALDDKPGALYAIRRPPEANQISALDARPYSSNDEPSIAKSLGSQLWWYVPPDINERLRIQRGSFLLGGYAGNGVGTSLPLATRKTGKNWLETRITNKGERSNTTRAYTDMAVFRITPAMKKPLRELLQKRSGLTISAIYPTPWERPFIEEFAKGYSRRRALDALPEPQPPPA